MAIVTIDDVLDHLNDPNGDSIPIAELQGFIAAAEAVVVGEIGDVDSVTYTEWYAGGGPTIQLLHPPVLSVTSVTEYRGNVAYTLASVAAPALATAMSYIWEPDGRISRVNGATAEAAIYLSSQGLFATFPVGSNAVRVVYQAGLGSVPGNVRMAVLQIIADSYQSTQQGGHPGFVDSSGPARKGLFVSQDVRDMLKPNRRPPTVA